MNISLIDVFKLSFVATIGCKVANLTWSKIVEPKLAKVGK